MSESLRATARVSLGRLLSIAAILPMLVGAFWPIFDVLPGRGVQTIAVTTAAITGLTVVVPLGSRLAFSLLWSVFGMACAIGVIGIFSIGFVYLISAVLLLLAIAATPNRSDLELKFDWRYIAAFYGGFLTNFLIILVL